MTKDEKDFVLDTMTWSFSRASSFSQCPLEWYRIYIDAEEKESNFFAEVGTLIHSILERYYKRELDYFDLVDTLDGEWGEVVVAEAPRVKGVGLGESYYMQCREYFENFFQPIDEERYEILGVEKETRTKIGGHDVVGYIDLLLLDKLDNKLIIIDHKSAKIKLLKNGDVSKTDAEQFKKFKKQLYVYAKAIREEYPNLEIKELCWNLFRDHRELKVNFDEQEMRETVAWFEEQIKNIYSEVEFAERQDDYYCRNLCSFRHSCICSPNYRANDDFWERDDSFKEDIPEVSW